MKNERLIDANALIRFIQDGLNSKDPNKQFGNDAVQIMAEIEFAPTIAPRDWTPCSDGLPTRCTEYRTTVLDARCGARFGKNMRFNTHTQQWTDTQQTELAPCYSVIAWQPLPEPYNPDHPVNPNKKIEEATNE